MKPHPLEKFGYALCVDCLCVRPWGELHSGEATGGFGPVCKDDKWCVREEAMRRSRETKGRKR